MALLRIIAICLMAIGGSLGDIAPAGGWLHWRPQAAVPHAAVIHTYRANLPAFYLLPPPPPVLAPGGPIFTRFGPVGPALPVAPSVPVAPPLPVAPAVPAAPVAPLAPAVPVAPAAPLFG